MVATLPLQAAGIAGTFTRATTVFLSVLLTTNLACSQDYQAPSVREAKLGSCHFRFVDPYKGSLSTDNRSPIHGVNYNAFFNPSAKLKFETSIRFSCVIASPQAYLDHALRLTEKGWVMDTSKEEDPVASRTEFYLLEGGRWTGAGTTHDITDGDEDKRMRSFGFCIPNSTYALCGMASNVAYQNQSRSSALPQVIKFLESIEFIDDANGAESKIPPPLSPAN